MLQDNECDCEKCQHGTLHKHILKKWVKVEDKNYLVRARQLVVTCDAHLRQFVIYQEYFDDCEDLFDPVFQFEACEAYAPREAAND
ncbi:hypothetical protein [Solidesulfovibrio carbinolicus]|nr:hypothetical protein [Solidesulfovibrio carbinolicus]